ncbi:50S ribosomal protein L31 [Patescibacteria group bacterium]|nr:50S ribosomal protein L31 [Patescibacteria group bacterium]
MKTNIHPDWFPEAKIVCACGTTFEAGSTLSSIRVDICSKCHPLFTGQQKFIDTLGQVDKFIKKTEVSKIRQVERKKILEARKSRVENKKKKHLSLKDLLIKARKQTPS